MKSEIRDIIKELIIKCNAPIKTKRPKLISKEIKNATNEIINIINAEYYRLEQNKCKTCKTCVCLNQIKHSNKTKQKSNSNNDFKTKSISNINVKEASDEYTYPIIKEHLVENYSSHSCNSNELSNYDNYFSNNYNYCNIKNLELNKQANSYVSLSNNDNINNYFSKSIREQELSYDQSKYNYSSSIINEDYSPEMIEISMSELIGFDYNIDYDPVISIPKTEYFLLEFNKEQKFYKYFNSEFNFQKLTAKEEETLSVYSNSYLINNYYNTPKREFGWVFINNGKIIIKLLIDILSLKYKVIIKSKNKRFKNIQGFDYFTDISYNEFFFLSIIKYIIYYCRKDKKNLYHDMIVNIDIHNNSFLFNINNNEFIINPALDLEKVKKIDLRRSELREDSLEFISESLYLSNNIRELILEKNKLDCKCAIILSKVIKSPYVNIISIALNENIIGDEGCKHLADSLSIKYTNTINSNSSINCKKISNNIKSIKTIGLYDNRIDNLGAKYIGDMFNINNTLEYFNIGKNIFSYEGLKYLIEGLSNNVNLKMIGLEFLEINDYGASLFKNLLLLNKSLIGINLSNNRIGDEGFKDICKGLEDNNTLIKLAIRKNCISNLGATCLSKTLLVNDTLENIYLQRNSISNDGCKSIILSLEHNSVVKDIHMYENSIYHDMKIYIKTKEPRIKI